MCKPEIRIPGHIKSIFDALTQNGHEAYLVGGCVRDALMGKTPHDYDITTDALPDETAKCFGEANIIRTGEKHGTVSVKTKSGCVEITTYRVDGEYSDNRHPADVRFTRRIEEDLARRDFTVNAMAYSPAKGIVDIFGGREDIERCIIRCVGSPDKRFNEDGLRILRALRFCSVLGFEADSDTAAAIHKNKELLDNISRERVYSELCGILCGAAAAGVCLEYSDVLAQIMPPLKKCIGFDQHTKYHCYDVYTHCVKTMEAVPPETVLRFAAFLHDCGKPECMTEDADGGHFYGHAKVSAQKAESIMRMLKADSKTTQAVAELVRLHDRRTEAGERAVKRFMAAVSEETVERLLLLMDADRKACAPHYADTGTYTDDIRALINKIRNEKSCFSLKTLDIKGTDIINLGVPEGKRVGEILRKLLGDVIDGRVENSKDILKKQAVRYFEDGI